MQSSKPLFEKFPPLTYKGRKLIWDTRQPLSTSAECVIWDKNAREEIRLELKNRVGLIEGSDSFVPPEGVSAFLAKVAVETWGTASEKLKILGVTGTNGKSTCVALLRHLLTARQSVHAEIGTLGVSVWHPGEAEARLQEESGFTTPEAHQLHYLFGRLVEEGVQTVSMECSSHAVELGRLTGVKFVGGLFTNLTQDHLDFHKTMERYENAKLRFFTECVAELPTSVSVINTQDGPGQRIFRALRTKGMQAYEFCRPGTYGVLENSPRGLKVHLESSETLSTSLVGDFNAENVVGCVELLHRSLGFSRSALAQDLLSFRGVMGRLERVTPQDYKFQVFVDYAHTPDALEKVLLTLQKIKGDAERLACVFGCGGDRDPVKRPQMGEIASRVADFVVVTSDNPRTEDPAKIIENIMAGVRSTPKLGLVTESDRKRAIEHALGQLGERDILVIAGKGHEQYQIIGKKQLPFSDQKVVREFLGLV